MIKEAIYIELRDSISNNALKTVQNHKGKIAKFNIRDRKKLGCGEGFILYDDKFPTKKEILSFFKKNLQPLYEKKHIVGNIYLEGSLVNIRKIQKSDFISH